MKLTSFGWYAINWEVNENSGRPKKLNRKECHACCLLAQYDVQTCMKYLDGCEKISKLIYKFFNNKNVNS